jgi:tetratricopeptide (TPR) repeat protein
VARDLGVATVLEGSIRKDGDQLRITAQLVKASDGFHLWSETYDRRLEGVFAIQEEIAEAIAKELKGSLGLESAESLIRNRTQDMGAYELYLEARGEVRRRGPGLPRAIDLFEQALARDSTFAPAWAGLAEAFSISPYYTGQGTDYWKEAFARAESAAERALELDPTLVSAHVALGNVHRDRWEWAEAERSFLRALELAPDDPEANQQYAEMLAGMGRPGEGAPFARRSVELDPLAAIRHNVLGYILWDDHQYEEGMASIRRALEIDSTLSFSRNSLVEQLLARGRYAEAEAALDEMGIPYEEGRRKLARALAAGDRAAATRALHSDSLLQSLYWAQALVGDRDGVIDALTGALAGGFFGGPFGTPDFLWDPVLDPYRDDPRFQALIRSRNLEPR